MVNLHALSYLQPISHRNGQRSRVAGRLAPGLQSSRGFPAGARIVMARPDSRLRRQVTPGAPAELLCYVGILANLSAWPAKSNGAHHVRIGFMPVLMNNSASRPQVHDQGQGQRQDQAEGQGR